MKNESDLYIIVIIIIFIENVWYVLGGKLMEIMMEMMMCEHFSINFFSLELV